MLNKSREFNGQVPPENIVRNEADLDELKDLIECRIEKLEEIHIRTLEAIIAWPNGELETEDFELRSMSPGMYMQAPMNL